MSEISAGALWALWAPCTPWTPWTLSVDTAVGQASYHGAHRIAVSNLSPACR
jgi:hypothetical protein